MAKGKNVDEKFFVNRQCQILCLDREETSWGPVEINSISELGVSASYDSRGVTNVVFIPMGNVSSIIFKSSQSDDSIEDNAI